MSPRAGRSRSRAPGGDDDDDGDEYDDGALDDERLEDHPTDGFSHAPVLVNEVLEHLVPGREGGVLWDLTLGPAIAVLASALGALAAWAPESVRLVVAQMIGIQLCLASLGDVDYMFTDYFVRDGQRLASDTQQIADHLLLPYFVWGALIALLSVAILAGAFWAAWMGEEK